MYFLYWSVRIVGWLKSRSDIVQWPCILLKHPPLVWINKVQCKIHSEKLEHSRIAIGIHPRHSLHPHGWFALHHPHRFVFSTIMYYSLASCSLIMPNIHLCCVCKLCHMLSKMDCSDFPCKGSGHIISSARLQYEPNPMHASHYVQHFSLEMATCD